MEAQFRKLLSHAKDDVTILSNILDSNSPHKILGYSTNRTRKTLGGSGHIRKKVGGGHTKSGRGHNKGWWSRPTVYKGRAINPHESIHDIYHRELKNYKGNPEEFQQVFESRLR